MSNTPHLAMLMMLRPAAAADDVANSLKLMKLASVSINKFKHRPTQQLLVGHHRLILLKLLEELPAFTLI